LRFAAMPRRFWAAAARYLEREKYWFC